MLEKFSKGFDIQLSFEVQKILKRIEIKILPNYFFYKTDNLSVR
jgi:hypothetical protein